MKLFSREDWYKNNPEDKGAGECAFCNNKNPEHDEYIIWRGKHWFICHNKYPVLGLKNQLMAIPYRHVLLSSNLTDEEYIEMRDVEKFMRTIYGDEDYFMFVREGLTSRSMEHIHYHFVPGRIPYDDIAIMLKKQGF